MANQNFTGPEMDEAETARLVQAALDSPARPLRADQIDGLVRAAAARQAVPGWIIIFLAAGPMVVILLGILNNFQWAGFGDLMLAVPLANLALSPFAALLLYLRLNRPVTQANVEKQR